MQTSIKMVKYLEICVGCAVWYWTTKALILARMTSNFFKWVGRGSNVTLFEKVSIISQFESVLLKCPWAKRQPPPTEGVKYPGHERVKEKLSHFEMKKISWHHQHDAHAKVPHFAECTAQHRISVRVCDGLINSSWKPDMYSATFSDSCCRVCCPQEACGGVSKLVAHKHVYTICMLLNCHKTVPVYWLKL